MVQREGAGLVHRTRETTRGGPGRACAAVNGAAFVGVGNGTGSSDGRGCSENLRTATRRRDNQPGRCESGGAADAIRRLHRLRRLILVSDVEFVSWMTPTRLIRRHHAGS